MPTWPASLPQEPNNGRFKETPPNTLVRETMDAGPDIVRRRYTGAVRKISLPYRLRPEQVAIFDDFLMTDLAGGAETFSFPWPPAPRATQTVTVRLAALPEYEHQGAGVYDLTLELEILP